mgnify:CR=1 FL=1
MNVFKRIRNANLGIRTLCAALGLLVTVAVTWLFAHEGHAPLPTKGAQVDVEKGRVVLAARWAYYVEGSRYGGEAGEPAILSARGVENNQSIVETQLEATVKAIAATGAEVVLLGPVPEQRFKVSPAVVRERVWGQTLPPAETHADFEVRQRHVMPLLEKLSHLPHVRILYPDRLLCDAQTCAFAHDGLPLYTDNNHLSIFGLQRIAPMVAEIFQVQPTASR